MFILFILFILFTLEYLMLIKYSLLLGFWSFFWGSGKILEILYHVPESSREYYVRRDQLAPGLRSECKAARAIVFQVFRYDGTHSSVRRTGVLVPPCAGYRLIPRNLSPHPPPLKFPPSLRHIYSLTRNINKHCLRSELNPWEDGIQADPPLTDISLCNTINPSQEYLKPSLFCFVFFVKKLRNLFIGVLGFGIFGF